jgi:O-antigen ligase
MEIWAALPEIARDHPGIMLFGAGTGAVDYYLGSYVTRIKLSADDIVRKHSHSSYLEWILSYGVLGSMFGLAALLALFRQLRRYDRLARDTAGLSLALFWGMSSLTTVTWIHPFSVVFTAMVVGLIKHAERLSIDARCLPLRMASAQPNVFDRSVYSPSMVNSHPLGRPSSSAINPHLK